MTEQAQSDYQHTTVLLKEAVDALAIKPDGFYIDATFGRGGHSQRIIEQLGKEGCLLVIDKDPQAIKFAKEKYGDDARVSIWHGSFKDFTQAIDALDIAKKPDGLLLDLGVSSPQLDDAARGFSFQRDGDLDMRMNPETGVSAAEWVNTAEDKEIADVLWRYGEERFSRQIARKILQRREQSPINTTLGLAELIASAIPKSKQVKGKNPATRSFQAIRIFINKELEDLEVCLQRAADSLAKQGRLVVISFHSLEDRMVKRFLKDQSTGPKLPRGLPVLQADCVVDFRLIGKAVKATRQEIENNVRSRSAIMRVGEKLV